VVKLIRTKLLVLYNLISNNKQGGGEADSKVSLPLSGITSSNHSNGGVQVTVKCVECGSHVPSYIQVPLCESCYQELLKQKLREDDDHE
jgi:hypothetical protein